MKFLGCFKWFGYNISHTQFLLRRSKHLPTLRDGTGAQYEENIDIIFDYLIYVDAPIYLTDPEVVVCTPEELERIEDASTKAGENYFKAWCFFADGRRSVFAAFNWWAYENSYEWYETSLGVFKEEHERGKLICSSHDLKGN